MTGNSVFQGVGASVFFGVDFRYYLVLLCEHDVMLSSQGEQTELETEIVKPEAPKRWLARRHVPSKAPNPKPYTRNPKPSTLNPKPCTQLQPSTRNPSFNLRPFDA